MTPGSAAVLAALSYVLLRYVGATAARSAGPRLRLRPRFVCSVWISEKCLDRDVRRIDRFDKTNLVQKVRTANASTKRFRELACRWNTFGAHLAFVGNERVFVSRRGSDQPGICRIIGSSLFPEILGLRTKDIKFALHISAVLFFDGKKKLTFLAEQESIESSVALQLYKYLPHRFQVAVCTHFN
jgi:hypothetical protein